MTQKLQQKKWITGVRKCIAALFQIDKTKTAQMPTTKNEKEWITDS